MEDVNNALKECGFGLFHIQLLCTSFVALNAGITITNSTSYILPVAECDLDMNLLQKGLLNGAPYFGMILLSIVGGFLSDTFGRKFFLIFGFGGVFIFTVLGGCSQTYSVLITAKFFEGVLFSTAFTPVITLTSEFCHNGIRDRVMLFQSSFVSVSQIVIALMSWAILPHQWKHSLFNGYIVFNTWNYYLFIMSTWSFLASFMYMFLPESPKYCITQKRYDEAREILISVYRKNTRRSADTFSYVNLWKDKSKMDKIDETSEYKTGSFSNMLTVGLHNVKPMFHKPLGLYALLFCTTNFFIMNMYNVIRLWFPQLSTIVEHYSGVDNNHSLCGMLDAYTYDLKMRGLNGTENETCVPNVSGTETYINSIVLGSTCIIPYIIGGVLVTKVGKKNMYIACGAICTCATLALNWATSKAAMVALFSSIVALSQVMMSLNQFFTVDIFPTTTRSLAVSLTMTLGRIGTLVGNVLFPILLDMGCTVPFFTLASTMAGVTLLSFVIPSIKT
ncbi:unnamed protein product, partial [Brenthis ino]